MLSLAGCLFGPAFSPLPFPASPCPGLLCSASCVGPGTDPTIKAQTDAMWRTLEAPDVEAANTIALPQVAAAMSNE
jgi:hypothetical protein